LPGETNSSGISVVLIEGRYKGLCVLQEIERDMGIVFLLTRIEKGKQ
jgi:hypothetical protein